MKKSLHRFYPIVLMAAGLAVAALGPAGCAKEPDTETTVVTTTPAPPDTTTTTTTTTIDPATGKPTTTNVNAGPGGALGNADQIATSVREAIYRNTQMTGSRVTPTVDAAGVVTLTGIVQNQQQKALAARSAEQVSGVVSVENKLEIRPTGGAGKTPQVAQKPAQPKETTKVIVVPMPSEKSEKPETGTETGTETTGPEGGTREGEPRGSIEVREDLPKGTNTGPR